MCFFLWFPMYCAYMNFNVWVICVSGISSLCQKWLESLWLIWVSEIHLSTYENLFLVEATLFPRPFVINVRNYRWLHRVRMLGRWLANMG